MTGRDRRGHKEDDQLDRLARYLLFTSDSDCQSAPDGGDGIPEDIPPHGFLGTSLVRAVALLVDNSGIIEMDNRWAAEERTGKHPGGRPPIHNTRQILILLLILAVLNRPLLLTQAVQLVRYELNRSSREILGIYGDDHLDIEYRNINRAFGRFVDRIDPFPGPRKNRQSWATVQEIIAARDTIECRKKMLRLEAVTTQLIEMTLRLVPAHLWKRWDGTVCVDGTVMPTWGKRGTPRSAKIDGSTTLASPDYDSGWHVRNTEDHSESGKNAKGKKPSAKELQEKTWGLDATIVVAANPLGENGPHPLLALGLAVDAPGFRVAENAMTAIDSIIARERKVTRFVGDRAYAPSSDQLKLQGPLKARSISIVGDYRVDQLGITDQNGGALLIEGTWYGPCIPTDLARASIDFREKEIDEDTYRKRIENRRKYALQQKSNADANGVVTMRCPAAGPSPTVSCALKPRLAKAELGIPTTRKPLPLVVKKNLPSLPPKICTNKESVSFGPEHGLKYGQSVPYKTPEWEKLYYSPRNTVEGLNGLVKNDACEAFAAAGRRRVRGRTAQTLLAAIMIAAVNIRKIRSFLRRKPTPRQVPKRCNDDKRRRRHHIADYLKPGTDPPEADGGSAA